jgi:hypothetical protein
MSARALLIGQALGVIKVSNIIKFMVTPPRNYCLNEIFIIYYDDEMNNACKLPHTSTSWKRIFWLLLRKVTVNSIIHV